MDMPPLYGELVMTPSYGDQLDIPHAANAMQEQTRLMIHRLLIILWKKEALRRDMS